MSRTSRSEFGTSATAEIVPTRMSNALSPSADTTGFTGAGVNAFISEAFELREMVEVVARQHADDRSQFFGAALGVKRLPLEILGAQSPQQRQVPAPRGQIRRERALHVDVVVTPCPRGLVPRLDPVVVLGEDLPDTEADSHLGVGEMREDLLARPFARAIAPRQARVAQPPGHRLDALGVGFQRLERVAVAQEP